MKILIPVLGFGKSGGYRVLSMLANELINSGWQVTFISSARTEHPHFPTQANILWVEKGKIVDDVLPAKGNFFSFFWSLRTLLKNDEITRQFDLILANQSLTTLTIPRKLHNKVIYYSQAYEPDYYFKMGGLKNYLLGQLSVKSYKQQFFTIVNAPLFKNFKHLKSKRVLIPGIDPRFFFPKQYEANLENKVILGTIGRKESYKGTDVIIEAFKLLHHKYPEWELRIAFGNPELEKLPGITCLFPKNDEQLGEYYRNVDFYLCAGDTHLGAFHYPVLEAMACGTTVVSTPYYGVNEQTAFVIKESTPQNLISLIEFALNNPPLRTQKVLEGIRSTSPLSWQRAGKILIGFLEEKLYKEPKTAQT